jgi:hypothetical protein
MDKPVSADIERKAHKKGKKGVRIRYENADAKPNSSFLPFIYRSMLKTFAKVSPSCQRRYRIREGDFRKYSYPALL